MTPVPPAPRWGALSRPLSRPALRPQYPGPPLPPFPPPPPPPPRRGATLKNFFIPPPVAELLGIDLVEAGDGGCTMRMEAVEQH